MGHMNVAHYVAKFDEATWQIFAMLGLTRAYFADTNCGMAAVQQNIAYRRELAAGDLIRIETAIDEMAERKLRFRHRMIDCTSGEEAATMELIGVHFDREAHRACPFPDPVRAACAKLIGDAA